MEPTGGARFAGKSRSRAGIPANRLETAEGEYLLDLWRDQKRLTASST